METVRNFIFLGSKITANGDCSHEIKRCLLFGRKAMTNLDSILKSRDIALLTKVCIVKGMIFPVIIYRCESWTVNKAEGQRIHAFESWCCRRLFRISWTGRRSNQSILKEINLKFGRIDAETEAWILGPLDSKSWLVRKDPDAWKDWRQKEKRAGEDEIVK